MKLLKESYTQKLVTFLADHLNQKLQEEAKTQPELVDVLAVRTTRSWDDPRFPLSDCPILRLMINISLVLYLETLMPVLFTLFLIQI